LEPELNKSTSQREESQQPRQTKTPSEKEEREVATEDHLKRRQKLSDTQRKSK
jgi:hypothetical protein